MGYPCKEAGITVLCKCQWVDNQFWEKQRQSAARNSSDKLGFPIACRWKVQKVVSVVLERGIPSTTLADTFIGSIYHVIYSCKAGALHMLLHVMRWRSSGSAGLQAETDSSRWENWPSNQCFHQQIHTNTGISGLLQMCTSERDKIQFKKGKLYINK